MAWVVLVLSGLFEAVWATSLSRIDSWERTGPIVVFGLGLAVSMAGLGWALRSIPVGTGYAVWVGIGAATTVAYAVATGAEPFGWVKLLLVLGIIACVVGLKLVH
jgi:quaternary ammonium compound-resistance protein SugE